MSVPVTNARAALHDLVETMAAIDRLYQKSGTLTEAEDRRLCQLEDRRLGLERQLIREVKEGLGIDYGVLWNAVTPTAANSE